MYQLIKLNINKKNCEIELDLKWLLNDLRYLDLERTAWHTQWPTMDYKYSLNKYYVTSFLCKRKTFHSSPSTLAHSWANIYYGQCKEILLSTSITLGTNHNRDTIQDVRLNLMRHSKGRTQKTAAYVIAFPGHWQWPW